MITLDMKQPLKTETIESSVIHEDPDPVDSSDFAIDYTTGKYLYLYDNLSKKIRSFSMDGIKKEGLNNWVESQLDDKTYESTSYSPHLLSNNNQYLFALMEGSSNSLMQNELKGKYVIVT